MFELELDLEVLKQRDVEVARLVRERPGETRG
jgi:hypothetical protein